MGEAADDFLDSVMDFEDACLDYLMGDMDVEEAMDRGIVDENGFMPEPPAPEKPKRKRKILEKKRKEFK